MRTNLSTQLFHALPKIPPVRRWGSLWPGDRVEIRSMGTHLHYATVDQVTEDGKVIWLRIDGEGRSLHLRSDSITLYRAD
jgi:hypothetical protein